MAFEPKIDFVISVRDRDNKRIQICVNSLLSNITNKIYVVDYGSKKPIKGLKNCKVIRVDTKNRWNKCHALNIGIKKCKSSYIGTVDCDMVIGNCFMKKVKEHLKGDVFLFTRSVARIAPDLLDWGLDREKLIRLSSPWSETKLPSLHAAVGGIQIFPKWWIFRIRGYDENLTYWGGMDNDIYERAFRTELIMIDINEIIFHQEHKNVKEQNLTSKKEQETALSERQKRRIYLMYKWTKNINVGPKTWGAPTKPQQNQININFQNGKKKKDTVSNNKQ